MLLFSDGVLDNLYDPDMIQCVQAYFIWSKNEAVQDFEDLQLISDCISDKAYKLGKNRTYLSPFAKYARIGGRENYPS